MYKYIKYYFSVITCGIAIFPIATHSLNIERTDFDDWITDYHCTEYTDKLCNGYYRQTIDNIDDTLTSQIIISADYTSLQAKGVSHFEGNVIARQGYKAIYADQATVIRNVQTGALEKIMLAGHVKIMQPGLRIDGSKAEFFIQQNKKIIYHAK